MQTMTVYLVDGTIETYPVRRTRYNQVWNQIQYDNEDGSGDFIHLHEKKKWDKPHQCSRHDATHAFLMNENGQTVARYSFTNWDHCQIHDLKQ